MTVVQEIRIAAIKGLEIPDGLGEGSRFHATCELLISKVTEEWVDVSDAAGPRQLQGNLVLGCVATEWTAT